VDNLHINRPLVTIAMPVFNCERTVGAAICSIQAQTFQDWELIVIDDGSCDRTLAVATTFDDPRIRLVKGGENLGLPARLNEAVALSRGRYFARMDGDDISYPARLEQQLAYLRQNPEVDLLGGAISIFDGKGELIGIRAARLTHEDICGTWWRHHTLAHVTWMGPIEWFRKNPYCPNALTTQDRELLMRTQRHSRFAAIPDILVGVREPTISLKKIIPTRWTFVEVILREEIQHRQIVFGALSALAEVAKLLLDIFAVGTGLNYHILRHRATPTLDPAVTAEWQSVWNLTSAGAGLS
jgi:glycosyltransferase involved in cell wall biosynthesis